MSIHHNHAILLSSDGGVYACGRNHLGRIGIRLVENTTSLVKLQCPEMVHLSNFFSGCIIGGCGSNFCFQSGDYQVVKETKVYHMTKLTEDNKVTHVSAGGNFTVWADTNNPVFFFFCNEASNQK